MILIVASSAAAVAIGALCNSPCSSGAYNDDDQATHTVETVDILVCGKSRLR